MTRTAYLHGLTLLATLASAPHAHAASCIPGFDKAAYGVNGVTFSGNGHTDSYDSVLGYAASHTASGGNICTSSTASGAVSLGGNATINGDTCVGAGGDASVAIQTNGNASTSTRSVQGTNQAFPAVSIPAVGTYQGNASNGVLAPNQTYGAVSCSGNNAITLNAGTYVMTSLSIAGNCSLIVGSGPITLYLVSGMSIAGNGISNPTNVASNLSIFAGPGVASLSYTGNADASFALYAPSSNVSIAGNGDIYGAVVGKTVTDSGNGTIHYDRQLASTVGAGFSCSVVELSRSTPIVATIGTDDAIVQGTYNSPTGTQPQITNVTSVSTWSFPYITGHMRARTAASVSTSASSFASGRILFDAATKIPASNSTACSTFNGTCRNVFTVTQAPAADGTSVHPPRVQLNDGNASRIGALIAPASVVPGIGSSNYTQIIRTIIAAPLGGVDRSTVAVAPASPLAGVTTRPTVIYFGATDGMVHAVCGSVGGSTPYQSNLCPSLGTELWAFLPRAQLPLVRSNTQRIDGSMRVIDSFGDFTNVPAIGQKAFHTILLFQTGFSTGSAPATYALDVTDPANPTVLWEKTQPAQVGPIALGDGLVVAAGQVDSTNVAFVETNNGGTGGAGIVTTALSIETGASYWQFSRIYPVPARGVAADGAVPASGIPGGAVGVDLVGQGEITDVVFGDLYGELWRLDAATGTSVTGTTPLFQFTTNKHPIGVAPTIYSNGSQQYAAFVSGGYVDPQMTSWSASSQSLIAVRLKGPAITDAATACPTCNLAVEQQLNTGDRGFSQALVVGTQLFASVDGTDINASGFGGSVNTGHVVAADLTGGTNSYVVATFAGASSLAANGTTLYSSSSTAEQQLSTPAQSAVGPKVSFVDAAAVARTLWLRTE